MALDVARILVCDAVILFLGNGLVHLAGTYIKDVDGFFALTVSLSHGLFALLYVVVAYIHVFELVRETRRNAKKDAPEAVGKG